MPEAQSNASTATVFLKLYMGSLLSRLDTYQTTEQPSGSLPWSSTCENDKRHGEGKNDSQQAKSQDITHAMSGHALPRLIGRYNGFGLYIFHIVAAAQRLLHVLS